MKNLVVGLFVVLCSVSLVEAAPVYVVGNECPSDTQMASNSALTRQYYVTPSLACVYDTSSNNLQGTTAEANTYLDVFGTGDWVGLGEDPTGFSFTKDAGNDDGTFTISAALASQYDQFALAVKDGSIPFWAIFLLPINTTSGLWGFGTEQGDLSHFVLYGFTGNPVINPTCPTCPPDDEPPPTVPEPSTLLLFGSGLTYLAQRYRKRK